MFYNRPSLLPTRHGFAKSYLRIDAAEWSLCCRNWFHNLIASIPFLNLIASIPFLNVDNFTNLLQESYFTRFFMDGSQSYAHLQWKDARLFFSHFWIKIQIYFTPPGGCEPIWSHKSPSHYNTPRSRFAWIEILRRGRVTKCQNIIWVLNLLELTPLHTYRRLCIKISLLYCFIAVS